MESNTFKVMITFPELLEEKIKEFNTSHKTDFKLIEVLNEEVPFCVLQGNNVTKAQIFNLGYSLAVKQYRLREEGKLEW